MSGELTKPEAPTHLLARLRSLPRDRRGATIIEFAAVAAPFIALMLATIQTSLVFFAQQCLETTAENAGRQLITGAAQKANMQAPDFAQLACKNLPVYMKCANLMIDVQTVDSFADVDTTTPTVLDSSGKPKTNWQYQTGGAGDIVVMRMMYLFPVVGGPLGFTLANQPGNRRLLVATSVFRTEPYTS